KKVPAVAARDIGATAAECLQNPASGQRIIELSGPEDYSTEDVAATFGRLLGRPIGVVRIPAEQILPALIGNGLKPKLAELYCETGLGIDRGRVAWEGAAAIAKRGSTNLETVARRLLDEARRAMQAIEPAA